MPELRNRLESMLKLVRRRLWWRYAAWMLAIMTLIVAVLVLIGLSPQRAGLLALIALAITALLLVRPRITAIDARTMAQHLDRAFPALEESATLFLHAGDRLTTLQNMQRERVGGQLTVAESQPARWLPHFSPTGPLLVLATAVALMIATPWLHRWWQEMAPGAGASGTAHIESQSRLANVAVSITPPQYTGLPTSEAGGLDLELRENSLVDWQLTFDNPGAGYVLAHSGGGETPLAAQGDGKFSGSATIGDTGLYRVMEIVGSERRALAGIHTLTVYLDQPPDIRIRQPRQTVLEIPMAGPATFETRALVNDDFGVDQAHMLASVGKGSGEGVKFRDQVIEFDASEDQQAGRLFIHQWDLQALGMEPGDEVYFFVSATDNREPLANQARSETIIVRWLDEQKAVAEFAGLAIDVMPDYFKSQRQIIIETEQLIADRETLDTPTFDNTSRQLAMAQSDLKERYGQFLGDEFGESEGEGIAAEVEAQADDHDDDDSDDAERDPLDGVGHDHEAEGAAAADIDTTGSAQELIARFAHDHGAAEIGPITARNPVGLMKRSISNMWQAELHLHLSEPEKALPFEYEALKYLNMARQADRIYTRRLGFEPPPVSEERRLSGKLKDVLEYSRQSVAQPDPSDQRLFRELVQLLTGSADIPLTEPQVELLEGASRRLTELARQRPALIQQAANAEKILTAESLVVAGCDDCARDLAMASWSLLQQAAADPTRGQRWLDQEDPMPSEYLQKLRQEMPARQGGSP